VFNHGGSNIQTSPGGDPMDYVANLPLLAPKASFWDFVMFDIFSYVGEDSQFLHAFY